MASEWEEIKGNFMQVNIQPQEATCIYELFSVGLVYVRSISCSL